MKHKITLLLLALLLLAFGTYHYFNVRSAHRKLKDIHWIQRALKSNIKKERIEAIDSLGNLTEPKYISFLLQCLDDRDASVRLGASVALTRLGIASGYDELIKLLLVNKASIGGGGTISEGAAGTLVFFQKDTFATLVRYLNDDDVRIREKVFGVISTIAGLHRTNPESFDYDPKAKEDERLKAMARIKEWGKQHVQIEGIK